MTFRTGLGYCLRASATVVSGSSSFAAILRKLMPVARNSRTWSTTKDLFRLSAMLRLFNAGTDTLHNDGAFELSYCAQDLH
jgi:hypothetical protein